MDVVDMKRGTFNSIRDQQQIEKYKCENTYTIYIKDSDDVSYNNGSSNHNSFKVRLNPIGKEHIKNAKVRIKSLRLPVLTSEAADYSGQVFIRSSIARNTVVKGGLTSGIIGSAYIEEAVRNSLITTNPIETRAGRPDYTLVNGVVSNVLKSVTITNRGLFPNGGNAAAPDAVVRAGVMTDYNEDHTSPLPDIFKAGDIISRVISRGCVGVCADTETLCENPFGKEIQFDILGKDISTLQETGSAASDFTTLVLEVQLLPDNQANDRFTN